MLVEAISKPSGKLFLSLLPKSVLRFGAFIPLKNSITSIFYPYDLLGSGYGYFSGRDDVFNTINPIALAECEKI